MPQYMDVHNIEGATSVQIDQAHTADREEQGKYGVGPLEAPVPDTTPAAASTVSCSHRWTALGYPELRSSVRPGLSRDPGSPRDADGVALVESPLIVTISRVASWHLLF
jgi:hypothetical protein